MSSAFLRRVVGSSLLICLWIAGCASSGKHRRTGASPGTAPGATTAAAPVARPVAIVDGVVISAAELAEHVKLTGQERKAAREDLIELVLLHRAAAARKLTTPSGLPPAEARAQLEYMLARALELDVRPPVHLLVVDHAWVKDAVTPRVRAQQRKDLEKLRGLVVAGATIPAAFTKLGLDGALWHIGDHETYGYDVVGPNANELPAGGLSPSFAGDGGVHLFKIHEHKQELPPAADVHEALRVPLRQDKKVELFDEK